MFPLTTRSSAKLPTELAEKFAHLSHLVGNTPLLQITFEYRGKRRVIYAKHEQSSLTGSIKDRMALHILGQAYMQGTISPGMRIAEATSGNTGISLAAIGRALGHPVTIFMPNWMSRERVDLIKSYGARIVLVSKDEGGFLGSIARCEELAKSTKTFLPRQFSNVFNAEAHEVSTGPELWMQLKRIGLAVDAFVAGVGTGGTIMGVGAFLRKMNSRVAVHPVEPAESPTLSTGCKVGHHRIQGISDEFIPALVQLDQIDEPIPIGDGDSILIAQRFSSELGLGLGISSGCNFLAAVKVQDDLGGDATVVTVFADDNKKYLTTDLVREEPVRDDYLSPAIQLIGFKVVARLDAGNMNELQNEFSSQLRMGDGSELDPNGVI